MSNTRRTARPRLTLRLENLEDRRVWSSPLPEGLQPVPGQMSFGLPQTDELEPVLEDAVLPADVTGASLTDTDRSGLNETLDFDDMFQGYGDGLSGGYCSIDSTLSAVARTTFDLEGHVGKRLGADNLYDVLLYLPDGTERWQEVVYDGTSRPGDPKKSNDNEIWTIIYQRAYRLHMDAFFPTNATAENPENTAFRAVTNAMQALTGKGADVFIPTVNPATAVARTEARRIQDALKGNATTGARPVVASTKDGAFYLDPSEGIVKEHAYTVVGVEIPASGASGIFVTLRNPWGKDVGLSAFDTDQNDIISQAELQQSYNGVADGNNDGFIRIPWAKFAENYHRVYLGKLAAGPSINTPGLPRPELVFAADSAKTATKREGELLTLTFKVADFATRTTSYRLLPGSPGQIEDSAAEFSGVYTWTPPAGSASSGKYYVTIIAETQTGETARHVLTIEVTPGNPSIVELQATPSSIPDTGSTAITLKAKGVISPVRNVHAVEFFHDTNGNGTVDNFDRFLGTGTRKTFTQDWTWTGTPTGLTAGPFHVLARASRSVYTPSTNSFSTLYSPVESASLTVTASPPPLPVVTKQGGEVFVQAGPVTNSKAVRDKAGNLSVFSLVGSSVKWKRYSPAGDLLGSGALANAAGLDDVAMAGDGRFVVLWLQGGMNGAMKFQRFAADATPAGSVSDVGDTARTASVAIDDKGEFVVAWAKGSYTQEEVYFRRFSAAGVLQGVTVRASDADILFKEDGQRAPDVVKHPETGDFTLVWVDFNDYAAFNDYTVWARGYTSVGVPAADAFILNSISGPSGSFGATGETPISVAMDDNGLCVAAWSNGQVWARRFDAFEPLEPEFRVNRFAGGEVPDVSFGASGHLAVVWTGADNLYGQVYDADRRPIPPDPANAALPGNFAVPTTTVGPLSVRSVVMDDDGDLTVSWLNDVANNFTSHTFLQRFDVDVKPTGVDETFVPLSRLSSHTHFPVLSDPEGKPVTVTAVDGKGIRPGETVGTISGASITLNPNGSLT